MCSSTCYPSICECKSSTSWAAAPDQYPAHPSQTNLSFFFNGQKLKFKSVALGSHTDPQSLAPHPSSSISTTPSVPLHTPPPPHRHDMTRHDTTRTHTTRHHPTPLDTTPPHSITTTSTPTPPHPHHIAPPPPTLFFSIIHAFLCSAVHHGFPDCLPTVQLLMCCPCQNCTRAPSPGCPRGNRLYPLFCAESRRTVTSPPAHLSGSAPRFLRAVGLSTKIDVLPVESSRYCNRFLIGRLCC